MKMEKNKRKILNAILCIFILSSLILYLFFTFLNKPILIAKDDKYAFSIFIFKENKKVNSKKMICNDKLPAVYFYEPLFNSFVSNHNEEIISFKDLVQVKIIQGGSFPIIFQVYKKKEFDNDVLKTHISDTLKSYVDLSNSCLGKLEIEIFPKY